MGVERKTFYGSCTSNICGYCYKHHLFLTPNQVKQRKCLAYRCPRFERRDHGVWEIKELRKTRRKERKARLEQLYQDSISRNA